MSKIHDLVEYCENALSVALVLAAVARDNVNLVSDEEELLEYLETAHEPAGLSVIDEEVKVDTEKTVHQRHDRRKLQCSISQ